MAEFLFKLPTNLHYSQTQPLLFLLWKMFKLPTNLHYSQTRQDIHEIPKSLSYLQIYTILKQGQPWCADFVSLSYLQIYTILKPNLD